MFQQSILDALNQMGFSPMGWQGLTGLSPGDIT